MSLHNGLDTVAITTIGIYTKTYGSSHPGNIANLFATLGFFEDAPISAGVVPQLLKLKIIGGSIKKLIGG